MTKRRRYIILVLVVLFILWLLNGLYQGQRNRQSDLDKPEFATVERGNLDVPISATGSVEPASRTEIKCKSSGTVLKIYFEAGDKVHKDDLLVELDPVDEQRTLNNAEAEVQRATASLRLSEAEAVQAKKDWPTQVRSALAELEGVRAALQGAVMDYKKADIIRQGNQQQQPTMDIIDPKSVTPEDLNPPSDPLHKVAAREPVMMELIGICGREIAMSVAEAKSAYALIDAGRKVVSENRGLDAKAAISPYEFQSYVIQLWKTESQMLASIAGVRKAVNMLIMVDQADTKVKLTREALGQAKVALDQAQQRLKDTKVYAPSDGMIQEVFVKKGQIISSGITTVTGGTPLLVLADVSKLFVESDVDEADIGRVRELASVERSARLEFMSMTQPATQPKLTKENEEEMAMLRKSDNVDVTVDAFREQTFTGKVDRVYPNPKNVNNIVTYNVRILLTSPNRTELMLGMHANVKFTSRKLVGVLKVDNEAIKVKHEERGVYIEGPGPLKAPMFIPVKVGLTNGTQIELKTDKLKAGDKVYVKLPPSKEEEKKTNEE